MEFFRLLKPGWTPPSAYQLSNRLLEKVSAEVEQLNEPAIANAAVVAIMIDGWSDISRGAMLNVALYIMIDGWSDISRGAVLNVALYTGISIFLKSVPPSADRHDADMIADVICSVIDSSGKVRDKVKAVVTDNAAVMIAAWREVERRYPSVHCYGCGAHIFNLLAGDLKKIQYIGSVIDENRKVAVFFKTHSVCREVLLEHTSDKNLKPLNTVLSCATRWSTDY